MCMTTHVHVLYQTYHMLHEHYALGVVAEWSKVLTAAPWPLMVWSTLALGTYQLRFTSWVFHVIFSFVHFISLYTLGVLRAFRKPLPYNMYLFHLRIANHILIKIKCLYMYSTDVVKYGLKKGHLQLQIYICRQAHQQIIKHVQLICIPHYLNLNFIDTGNICHM